MTEVKAACARVREELADIVDGDAAALARHGEHLADCDECRDARFAAGEAARALRGAGADHVAGDVEGALMARLAARGSGAGAGGVKAAAARQSDVVRPTHPQRGGGKIRRLWWAAAAVGVAAAAAATVVALREVKQSGGGAGGTAAKVVAISRAAADGQSGITFAGAPVALNGSVGAGRVVATDGRTRVKLELADGTRLTLNHETQIELTGPRALRLTSGEVVADVATGEETLAVTMPTGRVLTAGSLVAISAGADSASVRVARGHARIEAAGGATAVLAGEEALVPRGGKIDVAPAARLADAVGWSELEGEATDTTLAGIGELRAHKPGEKSEKERPLTLSRHKVTVRVSGNVARTEIEESFKNDGGEVLEGVYRFPLPPDARIDRLALWVGDKLEEGAFVERGHAAKIWQGIMHNAAPLQPVRPQEIVFVPERFTDPALLEWQRGGRFELKIYPIPAHGERKVILSYTQTVAPHGKGRRYVYPLAHSADASTRVGHFEVDARLVGHDAGRSVYVHGYEAKPVRDGAATKFALALDDFQPAGDLIVDYQLPGDAELRYWTAAAEGAQAAAAAVGAKAPKDESPDVTAARRTLAADPRSFVLFALRPEIPAYTENHARDYIILVDSSQSMVGERFARASALTEALVGAMDRRDRVRVMACDVDCRELGAARAPSAQAAREVRGWLAGIRPAGGSNLAASLAAATKAWPRDADEARELRVLYLGDGMSSSGPRRQASLAAEVEELGKATGVRVTTVGIGGDADAAALAAMARAGGGHYVPYVPGERVGASALAVLETTYGPSLTEATLELPPGVTDVSPAKLPTLRAGEEVLVSARFAGEIKGDVVVRGTVGGKPYLDRYPVTLAPSGSTGNGFVPRVWAQQRIDGIEQAGLGQARAEVVALSKTYGVMSRETSLLVLENEAMYRAMGIERGGQPTRWTGDEAATAGEVQGQAEHARATLEVGSMTGGFVGGAGAGRGGGGDAGGGKMGDLAAATRTGASGADEESEADDDGELLKDLMAEKSDNKAGDKTPVPSDDRVFAESDRRERETKTKKSPAEAKPATTAPAPDAAMRRPPAKEPFDPFAANRGQRGHYIKRVWFRVGSVTVGALSDGSSAVSLAEQRLGLMPDSRDRRRTLVQALARNGQVDRALAETEAWLARAPGDADALTSLADLTARKGDRKEAIRFLSGITDLAPDNRGYHERLAGAYQRLGDLAHECAHRVALAELAFGDATLVGAGVRCERAAGREAAASRLLLGVVDAKVRTRAEAAAGVPATTSSKKPELALSASWGSSDVDLDVALVAPSGSRISWMGGRKVSGDPASAGVMGRDRLSWPRTSRGSYLVEITRTKAGETTPVAGEVEVTVLGVRRVLPFTLSGERVVIGRIDISNQSKWVTVTDPRSFR